MHETLSLNRLMNELQLMFEAFPDLRTGQNTRYEVSDAGKGAFSVFIAQCASFLEHQEEMQRLQGRSNAQTLFGMSNIPSDSHTHARFALGFGLVGKNNNHFSLLQPPGFGSQITLLKGRNHFLIISSLFGLLSAGSGMNTIFETLTFQSSFFIS